MSTVAVAGFVFYESTRAAGDPAVPSLETAWTYVGHVAVYAVLAFCAQTAVLSRRWQDVMVVVVAATAFGVGIEVYQSTLDGRTGSAYDALANLLGAVAGSGVAYWLTPRWGRWLRV